MKNHSVVIIPCFARAGRTEYAHLSGELMSRRYHDETVGRLFSCLAEPDGIPRWALLEAIEASQEVYWAMPAPDVGLLAEARTKVELCESLGVRHGG